MKDSQLHAHVLVKTSNVAISRRRYAEYRKRSTIIFPLLTNDVTVLWRYCCRRRRRLRFLSSHDDYGNENSGGGGDLVSLRVFWAKRHHM